MQDIEPYGWEVRLAYRLIAYFILPWCRRYFAKAVEERAREIVASKAPAIFWAGFGIGAVVVLVLVFASMPRTSMG